MSVSFALFTSDPSLLRCQLDRLEECVLLSAAGRENAVGFALYAQDEVLTRRLAHPPTVRELAEAWYGDESEALLYHAREVPVGGSLELGTQPFRYRHWLFVHQGELPGFEKVRAKLVSSLPEYLQRQLRGDSDSELAFGLFLRLLRDEGWTEDKALAPARAAQLLEKASLLLRKEVQEAGVTRPARQSFLVTNGQMLLASRLGEARLYYKLLEGADRCARCGLEGAPDARREQRVRQHLRQRTVAVATHLSKPAGWVELPDGRALAVDRKLDIQVLQA